MKHVYSCIGVLAADVLLAGLSLIATTQASDQLVPGQSIGIDFDDGGNTAGAGTEVNFNVLTNANVTLAAGTVIDTTGAVVTGVSITGADWNTAGGMMGESDVGYGGTGNDYTGSPFSDLSFNDGTWELPETHGGQTGPASITFSGLNDALTYELLAVGGRLTGAVGFTVEADGQSVYKTYADIRNGSGPISPLELTGLGTDGSGNLVVTFEDVTYFGVNALHLTAAGDPTDDDSDGLPDNWEMAQTGYVDLATFDGTIADPVSTGAGSGDFDGDGVADIDEYNGGSDSSDPGLTDSDGDGLDDGVETRSGSYTDPSNTGTSPLLKDTDGDGFDDNVEQATGVYNGPTDPGTDPNKADTDGDGLRDDYENNSGTFNGPTDTGTDPHKADTDGDGWQDGLEVAEGTNPNLDTDFPNVPGIPTDNLLQDLDADLGVVEGGGAGTGVTEWLNQVAGAGDDVVTNTVDLPAIVAGPNGHDAIALTQGIRLAGDDPSAFSTLINGNGCTWFAVVQDGGNDGTKNAVFGTLQNIPTWSGVVAHVGSGVGRFLARPANADNWAVGSTDISTGWHIIAGRLAVGTGTVDTEVFTDSGTVDGSGSVNISGATTVGELAIGSERAGGGEYFDGKVARILIWNRPLSDLEMQSTFVSLQGLYLSTPASGLALSIDALTPTTLNLTVTGAPNTTYLCKSSTDLLDFSITETTTPATVTTDGSGTASFTIDITGHSELYLRAEVAP